MPSGFVSAGTSKADEDSVGKTEPGEEEESWAAAESAIKLARWQQENSTPGENDGKSLYDILQANKAARKQEEFEEKLKFKHQFKPLDEDDVEFLDSILQAQVRNEFLHKKELQDQLNEFRKAQYETELQISGGGTSNLENLPKVEDIVVGGWKATGRKRKKSSAPGKGDANVPGANMKKPRKASTSGDKVGIEDERHDSKSKSPNAHRITNNTENSVLPLDAKQTSPPSSPVSPSTTKPLPTADNISKSASSKASGLMGLVTYSSEDED